MQFSFLQKNKKTDYYLGLLLKEDQGIAIIISAKTEKAEVVDFEKFDFSNSWENIIEDIDEVLYRLESKHKLQFEETIFCVYSHLIDEKTNQIKKPYQQKIKNIAKDLELKPLGFIDCREAVTKTLENKDENKLTGIIVELDKANLSVFVYKAGQVVFAKTTLRTSSIVDDLGLIFEETKGKILLPTRMILYNSKDLDFEVTRIVSFRWSTDLFIQLPRVEIVQEKEIIQSLVCLFKQQIKIEKVEEPMMCEETVSGFVIGQDVKNIKQPKSNPENILKKVKFPKFNFSFIRPQIQKKFFLFLGLLIIFFGIFVNEYFLHKVKIEIFVPSENLRKSISVSAGESGNVDLTIKSIKKAWEISTTSKASGTKKIGDPAGGEVMFYNYSKETTFTKGTKITADSLTFTLDDEVKVASASLTTDGSAKLPGKTKGRVTATQIGTESNLSKGQTFRIEDLDMDVYFAKNESDFSGGSQKQITTVSEKDILDLKADIENKAKQEKTNNFNLSSNEKIITELTSTKLIEKNYSKEVGEEAANLTLTAKVETTVYTYEKEILLDFLYQKLKTGISTGFSLDKKKISYEIKDIDNNKNSIDLEILTSAKAIKNLDKNQVIKNLLARQEKVVDIILKKEFAITGYKLNQHQPLAVPIYKSLLPFFPKNFEIEIGSL